MLAQNIPVQARPSDQNRTQLYQLRQSYLQIFRKKKFYKKNLKITIEC